MTPTIQVLYAEDNRQDAELTRIRFARQAPEFAIEVVETGQMCLDRMRENGFDVLLLDHRLPDMDGLDVLTTLAHSGARVPVVLVTGVGDEDLVVKALRSGASSYVPKTGDYLGTLPGLLRDVVEEHRLKGNQTLLPFASVRRILYVEHVETDIELTSRHLAEAAPHLVLDVVHSCAEALVRLGLPQAYDLALIDLRMPDRSGLEFVREAKRRRFSLPPFIIVTGRGDEATAIATLRLGAVDYITKSEGYLDQLPHRIEQAIAHDQVTRLNERLQQELSVRQQAEAEVQEAAKQWQGTFDALSDAVLLLDADQRIRRCNRATANLFGGAPEDLSGRHCWEVVHGTTEPIPECPFKKMRTSHKEERVDCRIGERWVEASVDPILGEQQTLRGAVHILHDITGRRQAQADREKLQAELLQAQKMETVGRLASGIAHDFNNLLVVINNTAALAAMSLPEGDPSLADLAAINEAGRRAAALTGQLLAFSRKQVLQPVVLNLNTVVNNIEPMLRRVIGEDIQLCVNLADDLPNTRVDPGQIEQVIMNLAVNSRDAMPTGGTLEIQTSQREFDGAYADAHAGVRAGPFVMLAIADTGCGMDEKTREMMFEPFFTTKGPGRGTGLGLSTVYGILKQSGGHIEVRSEVGEGTVVKLYVPLVEEVAQPRQQARAGRVAHGTETILVVDDDEEVLRTTRRILEKAGYVVLAVHDGRKALRLLERDDNQVDLLVTDVVMPGISGPELIARVSEARPDLKVLYTSGYTDDDITRHGVVGESSHFIGKPYSIEDLQQKVRGVLDS